jgi:Tol biopolymer transport system component
MIVRDDFDRMVTVWLDETAGAGVPDYLDETLEGLARIEQRPAWMRPWRWLAMQLTVPRVVVPRVSPYLALLALLVLLVIVGLAIMGSQHRLPDPFGPASNGRIVYLSDGQLWTAAADGSDARAITLGSSTKSLPLFSRDGTRIAFLEYSVSPNPTLVVSAVDGSNQVTIVTDAESMRHVSWSPDGRSIAYSLWIPPNGGQRDRIFLAASDGSSPPTQIGDPDMSAFYPAFSLDGKRIAFVSDLDPAFCGATDCVGDDTFALQVMSSDGTDIRRLAHATIQPRLEIERYARLVDWRPDGSSILFTGHDITEPLASGIFSVASDGASAPSRIDTGPGSAFGATWSPDGNRIAFIRGGAGRWELVVSEPDGGNPVVLATEVAQFGPQWSPDGNSVAILGAYSGTQGAIRIVPIDRGPETVVPMTIRDPSSVSAPGIEMIAWQRLAR